MSKLNVRLHYTYYILIISFLLTGQFLNIIIITMLILVHELGHYIACVITKIKVKEIIIYPYGGITKINDVIDIPLESEFIISISGIIMQSLFYLLIFILYRNNIVREYSYLLFRKYHYTMLIFNLVLIYPLDGIKILNVFINKIFNYRLSNIIVIVISIVNIFVLFFYFRFNYSYVMIVSVLVSYIIDYVKNINYIYNRFLLEKYLYRKIYKRKRIIDNKNKMYRNTTHLVRYNKKYYKEDDFLRKVFD